MLRTILNCRALAGFLLLFAASTAAAQDHPARRLSNIVGVAVEEYSKAVDERGRLVSEIEYQEAIDFLTDARGVADRLSGDRAGATQAALDSLIAGIRARRTPADIGALHAAFTDALGSDGALELPTRAVDLAAGRRLYTKNCASCHGDNGLGDGPAGAGMNPAPPALGSTEQMHDVSPAWMYRVVTVGIAGTPMVAWSGALTSDERWDIVAYLTSLRSTPAQRLEGEGLFLQQCAACHGSTGHAEGVFSSALTRLPPELDSFGWQAARSDAQLAEVIRTGIPGSAMPPSRSLTPGEIRGVVAYVRTLALRDPGVVAAASTERDGAAIARQVMSLVDAALGAGRAGRSEEANDRAFDAYLAFEPLETPARGKAPGLVAAMERHFLEFKGALRANDVRSAEAARNAIEVGLPGIVDLAAAPASGLAAFIQSFLIILREGLEAILVIGAVVTFLIKTGHRDRLRSIWIGAGLALLASGVTAVVLQTALRAMPASREILEGATMLVAVAVLFSVSYWLISKVEAAKWQRFIKEKVSAALERGGGRALATVAFLAVYREGAETALFYQALFNEGRGAILPLVLGMLLGFAVLAVIFTFVYRFGVRIPLRPFFAVTSTLLYFMAFVFMGKGIKELQEGNAISVTGLPGFPHVEALGIYPTVETLLAQLLLVVLFIFALAKTFWPRRSVVLPTIEPAASPSPSDVRVADH
jgi:high-affinity iron transporter